MHPALTQQMQAARLIELTASRTHADHVVSPPRRRLTRVVRRPRTALGRPRTAL